MFDPGFRPGFSPPAAVILADELGDRHVEDFRAAVDEVKGRVARLALVVREVDPGGAEFFGELLLREAQRLAGRRQALAKQRCLFCRWPSCHGAVIIQADLENSRDW